MSLFVYRQLCNGNGKHAGEWYVSDGKKDVAGPFPPYDKAAAKRKMKEIEEAEIPNIFDDIPEGE